MPKTAIHPATVLLSALLLTTAACESAEMRQQIQDLQAAAAQKDSLVAEVATNARLMSQIGAEIARAQGAPIKAQGGEQLAPPPSPDTILAGIRMLTARLDSTQVALTRSEARARTLRGQTSNLRRAITELRAAVDNQKATIAALTEQVASLQQENTRLTTQNTQLTTTNAQLSDTVTAMGNRAATVYYVIGTKDDLLKQGVVKQTGGSHFLLIFGKRGQVLVPTANMDSTQFTAIDMRTMTEIPLPDSTRSYKIVTPQDLSALSNTPDDKGRIRGSALHITDADKFWAKSHYLIVVES